jgi:hypothetical protein
MSAEGARRLVNLARITSRGAGDSETTRWIPSFGRSECDAEALVKRAEGDGLQLTDGQRTVDWTPMSASKRSQRTDGELIKNAA